MKTEEDLIWESYSASKTYYHGSMNYIDVGTILTPRMEDYERDWENTDFYSILEYYRPKHMLSHKESVFMVGNDEDVDLAGGGTEWLLKVQPLGVVEKHDMNWSSEISLLVSENEEDLDKIKNAALNYWNGVPHDNESVWEYLTPKAKVLEVEVY